VRVHDARIATFGERVEDFFVLADAGGSVLTDATHAALRERLLERLGSGSANTRSV
jgi:[protein-PII] uridylyltransferase